jgi:hypothetical protein
VQAGNNAAGGDENVAWQEGLEVYEGVGEGCDVKDLAGSVYSMWCLSLSAVQQQRAYLGRDHKRPKLDHGILCWQRHASGCCNGRGKTGCASRGCSWRGSEPRALLLDAK